MQISVRELLTYLIASGFAFAVDVGMLTFLVHIANWHYVLASIAAFITGGFVLYVLAISYVFRFRRLRDPRIEGPVFIALGLIGLAVNTIVMIAVIRVLAVVFDVSLPEQRMLHRRKVAVETKANQIIRNEDAGR